MSSLIAMNVAGLHDPATLALKGFKGADGNEYLLPALDGPATFQDLSGTPGNATINADRGKVAIAAGQSTVNVTNSIVTAQSVILATQVGTDATMNNIVAVVPGAGSFTITANAAATGNVPVGFLVIN